MSGVDGLPVPAPHPVTGAATDLYLYRLCEILGDIRDSLQARAGGEAEVIHVNAGADDQTVRLVAEPDPGGPPARESTTDAAPVEVAEPATPKPPARGGKGRAR